MDTYKIINNAFGPMCVLRNGDTSIPFNTENTDYAEYLRWLSEGNTPIPADEVTQ